jgi:hypothetical protein
VIAICPPDTHSDEQLVSKYEIRSRNERKERTAHAPEKKRRGWLTWEDGSDLRREKAARDG